MSDAKGRVRSVTSRAFWNVVCWPEDHPAERLMLTVIAVLGLLLWLVNR
jgi:hypothetical protein